MSKVNSHKKYYYIKTKMKLKLNSIDKFIGIQLAVKHSIYVHFLFNKHRFYEVGLTLPVIWLK